MNSISQKAMKEHIPLIARTKRIVLDFLATSGWIPACRQFSISNIMGLTGITMFLGCSTGQEKIVSRPNILWICFDDARADGFSCYGKVWAKTPYIDRLAKEGVRFHNAIVQNPVCIPSRNSMKTGYYAYEAGPVEMGWEPEFEGNYIDHQKMKNINESPILLDAWTAVGMKPVNVGKLHAMRGHFDHRWDVPMLFDVYGNPTEYFKSRFERGSEMLKAKRVFTKTHHWQIGGKIALAPEETETWRLGDTAITIIKELLDRKEPFFLRVSFSAPHVACYIPEEYFIDPAYIDLPVPSHEELDGKPEFEKGPLKIYGGADLSEEEISLCRGTYYGMIAMVDYQVGRIIKTIENKKQLNNTLIVVTSDQGFQLGEHGLWKKRVFYEGNIRVPFIIHYPKKLPKGVTIEEPVELIDCLPTLMELSGFKVPLEIRGRSLLPLINGEVKQWREACFAEIDHSQSMYDELRHGTGRRIMVRTKEWKLIYFMDDRVKQKDGALYHLINDPDEKVNLYNHHEYQNIIYSLEHLAEEWNIGENLF